MGRRLRQRRGNRTLKEIGESAGITQMSLHRYEHGAVPPADALDRMASALGVTARWLMTGEDDHIYKVAEAPEPYGDLERSDRKTLDEVAELLRAADSETKGDLKYEINKIQRLAKLPKKRA